jgi:hypothetical protein
MNKRAMISIGVLWLISYVVLSVVNQRAATIDAIAFLLLYAASLAWDAVYRTRRWRLEAIAYWFLCVFLLLSSPQRPWTKIAEGISGVVFLSVMALQSCHKAHKRQTLDDSLN